MQLVSQNTFEIAVARYFAPMAKRLNLPLVRKNDELYEIPATFLTMQVCLDSGHSGYHIVVRLYPTANPEYYYTGYGVKRIRAIDIYYFVHHVGADIKAAPTYNIEVFIEHSGYIQKMAEKFCVPYMLDEKDDFKEIKAYVDSRYKESRRHWKEVKFPKNFRQEWRLPE